MRKKNQATINRNINEKVQYLVRWLWWYICNFLPFSLFGFFYFSDSMAMHIFEVTIFYKHWIEHCIFYKSINWIRCFLPLLSFLHELYLQCGRCWMFEAFMAVSCTHCKITGKIDSLRTLNLWRQLILFHTLGAHTNHSNVHILFFFSAWMSRNLSNMYCVCV